MHRTLPDEHPDLQAARLNFEQEQIQSRFERNQILPQLDLIGSYGHGASGNISEFSDAFENFARGNRPGEPMRGEMTFYGAVYCTAIKTNFRAESGPCA